MCESRSNSATSDVTESDSVIVLTDSTRKRARSDHDGKVSNPRASSSVALAARRMKPAVDDEETAVALTSVQDDDPRPNRRIKDFVFHDADGKPRCIEMLEVDDIYITGLILPLEESSNKQVEKGYRCESFGRIETWTISGYEDGVPIIWVSTYIADYNCYKASLNYKKLHNLFLSKAFACLHIHRKLSRNLGGDPDIDLEQLLAKVFRSMSRCKSFPDDIAIVDFVVSQGEFIYNQLIGLDETAVKNDQVFKDLPVLTALVNKSKKRGNLPPWGPQSRGSVFFLPKLARLIEEEVCWMSMRHKSNVRPVVLTNKFYIAVNEDEISDYYPGPTYYKPSFDEIFEGDVCMDGYYGGILHNWSIYDSNSRLVSFELLPMKPCARIDVKIFGSGVIIDDQNDDMNDDNNFIDSMISENIFGTHVYLSAIKEWIIEYGSSMSYISIRTDMGWYKLGKPSKEYAPWCVPVFKTVDIIKIIDKLNKRSRNPKFSLDDVIRKLCYLDKNDNAFISSDPFEVERFIVVHGPLLLQLLSTHPDNSIRKSPFLTVLSDQLDQIYRSKRLMKRMISKPKLKNRQTISTCGPSKHANRNASSRNILIPPTTTRLISRIWGPREHQALPPEYSDENYAKRREDETIDTTTTSSFIWDGETTGKTREGDRIYKQAVNRSMCISVGCSVILNAKKDVYFVEYMYETKCRGEKMAHGRVMMKGCVTILGDIANERELFWTDDCLDFKLNDVEAKIVVEFRSVSWDYKHRKANHLKDKIDKERADDRKIKGLEIEYYCKSLYSRKKGAFFRFPPRDSIGLGNGVCACCKSKKVERKKKMFKVNRSRNGFTLDEIKYKVNDFMYVSPHDEFEISSSSTNSIDEDETRNDIDEIKRLRAFVICQLIEIGELDDRVQVRRFFRPEDVSNENAYVSDIREVYFSEEIFMVPITIIRGKCRVGKKKDVVDNMFTLKHVFFCEHAYDPQMIALYKLPPKVKLSSFIKRKKVNTKEEEKDVKLDTLDIFAGCGGLSEGFKQAGVSKTKWAIEYDEWAGEAFKRNHPESLVFINNCNVLLSAIMSACGEEDDCVSASEVTQLAKKLDKNVLTRLPLPGEVEFISGGPPCQGFSWMNRFNQSIWSKTQCDAILSFLSYVDFYRPKFFLLENVRTFITFNKGQTFRLTLASLLEMGYQVRFGVLQAGAYGVSQTRKRAFIWAASPDETLPEWPEPMHVFYGTTQKITLDEKTHYEAVPNTAKGAPFRTITVRDTIGDLPPVLNGASTIHMDYLKDGPVSWFQKKTRGNEQVLSHHVTKEMHEANLMRCQRIPKCPGADWRQLVNEKVVLSTGEVVDLVPSWLPKTASRNNKWKGLYGRLDWDGYFPTSITNPQPTGKVGRCLHPKQDRVITVRECARSQGFPDRYEFIGTLHKKHKQIGNAVPPPLAYALGIELKRILQK